MKHRKQMFREHTRIVDTIQKLHRACTNNAPNMHKESRRKCRQGEKWKFLVERMGEKYAWPCVKYKCMSVKKLVIKKWILPLNKRLPIIHYRCFVMKSFLGCWVPNPFSHMYYVIENPNTFFITSKWEKKKKNILRVSIWDIWTHSSFLSIAYCDRTWQWDEESAWTTIHVYFSTGQTLPQTPTLFQATGRLWSLAAGGLKQGGAEGGGGRGWVVQVNSYIERWREEPSSGRQRITVWAYFLYQQGGSRKKKSKYINAY